MSVIEDQERLGDVASAILRIMEAVEQTVRCVGKRVRMPRGDERGSESNV
jgi:hypothetical protein